MKPDDQKLEQWLRDVAPPADLKDRLREIARSAPAPDFEDRRDDRTIRFDSVATRPRTNFLQLAIAAAIAGLGLFLCLPRFKVPHVQTIDLRPEPAVADSQLAESASLPLPPDQLAAELLQAIQSDLDRIEWLQARISLEDRQRQLARLPMPPEAGLDPLEIQSLIAFSAGQSRLEWGGDPASVKAEWQELIAQYPGTAGAAQAASRLDP